jgi:hypothetical protein
MNYITTYCHINSKSCRVNGTIIVENTGEVWFKNLYRNLDIKYPKFHKMDRLSQLAFLASEYLIRSNEGINSYKDDEIALIFSNKTSSLDTDIKYQNSYKSGGAPSPALFVYTLPNILLGEISIRNKLYGENMFTVFPSFNQKYFVDYPESLLGDDTKACLCGWVEVHNDEIEAFLFFIEKIDVKQLNLLHTEKNIELLYNQTNG